MTKLSPPSQIRPICQYIAFFSYYTLPLSQIIESVGYVPSTSDRQISTSHFFLLLLSVTIQGLNDVLNSTLTDLKGDPTGPKQTTRSIEDDDHTSESTSVKHSNHLQLTSEDITACLASDAELVYSGYTSGVISLLNNGSSPTRRRTFLTCDVTISVPDGMFFLVRFSETESAAGEEFFKRSVLQKQFAVGIREQQGVLCEECMKRPPVTVYSRGDTVRVQIRVMHFDFHFSFGFNFTAVNKPVVPRLAVVFSSATEGRQVS